MECDVPMDNENHIFEIDQNLLHEFLIESLETLSSLEPLFVQFEAQPDNYALIDSIFRPIHSVKGNSAFFGLSNIKQFSHVLENLLQDIRNRTRKASPEIIDILLRGSDALRSMVQRRMDGQTGTTLFPEEDAILNEVAALRSVEEQGISELIGPAMQACKALAQALEGDEQAKGLEPIQALLKAVLETLDPDDALKATSQQALAFIGEVDVTEMFESMRAFVEDLLTESQRDASCSTFLTNLRDMAQVAEIQVDAPVLKAVGDLRTDFQTIYESGIGFDDLLAELIQEKFEYLSSSLHFKASEEGISSVVASSAAPDETSVSNGTENGVAESSVSNEVPDAEEQKRAAAQKNADAQNKTIRIAEEKVDHFMHYVGELIVTGEVFSYIQKRLSGIAGVREIAADFKKANIAFNELSINLQRSLMEVRRVPLKNVFQMFPRMVRDLAKQLNKDIHFEMDGQMVQLDKSILEKLEAPLTHMIRNSVDHGIESEEERLAAGKPAAGTIRLRAEGTENMVRVYIEDDGRGLHIEKLRKVAVDKGLYTADRAALLTDQEVRMLIFHPGFSTAAAITDVSGRGVGMDVVNTNINEMNGTLAIASEEGVGTTITLMLPQAVTLMVVEGLLAQVGSDTFIVPLKKVSESIRPHRDDISTVRGQGEVVNVRDQLYPLIRMHSVLGLGDPHRDPTDAVVILVESDEGACGLLVDDLLGQQSVVLKDLSAYFSQLHIIKGGAILGDGSVGLVLDLDGIISQYVG